MLVIKSLSHPSPFPVEEYLINEPRTPLEKPKARCEVHVRPWRLVKEKEEEEEDR
ncbi:MAG: hypothetical protein KME31_20495 [Tolypothrix carrinoi HA7290-LM1]|nr:hypothetical protein [Tolypothrix carrinoi HA7290-LM1]